MEEWQVVAILDRLAGNAEVGEMWQETKVFGSKTSLLEVMLWAQKQHGIHSNNPQSVQPELFRGKLTLTIAQ